VRSQAVLVIFFNTTLALEKNMTAITLFINTRNSSIFKRIVSKYSVFMFWQKMISSHALQKKYQVGDIARLWLAKPAGPGYLLREISFFSFIIE